MGLMLEQAYAITCAIEADPHLVPAQAHIERWAARAWSIVGRYVVIVDNLPGGGVTVIDPD